MKKISDVKTKADKISLHIIKAVKYDKRYFNIIRTLGLITLVLICGITAYPSAVTVFSATTRQLPVYCVNTDEKKIAVTFDAAWGADDTELLLKILKDNEVKATFFLCGSWVDDYPNQVVRIYEEGHEIGNHGDTHADGTKISLEKNKTEILGVHRKIKELIGIEISIFRPPYGAYNNNVITAADQLGYQTIQWDVDSLDWKEYGVERLINQVLNHKHLGNGSIILFHNDAKYTPEALDTIIKGLKDKGFEFVTVSDLIYKSNYYMDHEGRQHQKIEEITN